MRYILAILLMPAAPAVASPIKGRATVVDGDTIIVEGAKTLRHKIIDLSKW